ncbi:alpha/beta hydrolase [Streptomyces kanasensis]|uniref:alpha/beta hydrolase n=1 Tax=Streptomyces kanasensis TaxID=936756 RepID=UPI0036F64726
MPGTPPSGAAVRVALDAGGLTLSGLLAEPAGEPRGTVLALHGGGMTAGYFDGRAHPSVSLLALGARLGYTVLAVDRPGYGASAPHLPDGLGVADQAELLRAAIADFAARYRLGGGLLVLGHSFGGQVALTAAAQGLHEGLVGLDISGCGHRHALPGAGPGAMPGPGGIPSPAAGPDGRRRTGSARWNWGPPSLYPPGTFTAGAELVCEPPAREVAQAARWPRDFPRVAARTTVPVRLTFAEHEAWWRHDAEALAELTAYFTAAERVQVARQTAAGHNISLGWAAGAYHRRVFAFFEELLCCGGPAHRLDGVRSASPA